MLPGYKCIDLTHALTSNCPTWSGGCGFRSEIGADYDRGGYRTQNLTMQAGIGTHMDAPSHFCQGGCSIAEIPLEQLIAPLCLVDISRHADADYQLSLGDLAAYEHIYGPITAGSIVVAYTGWSRFWSEPVRYRGLEKSSGVRRFPSISAQAAQRLVELDVAGIGIDTLSPDSSDPNFPVHQTLLGAGKFILENLANCDQLPAAGAYLVALPLKMEGVTESAVRAIGLIPR